MASLAPSPQPNSLKPALRALRNVRELESEFIRLRSSLGDLSSSARPEALLQNQIASLLSKVVVFRIVMAIQAAPNEFVTGGDTLPDTALEPYQA